MPSPIAHSLTGCVVYRVTSDKGVTHQIRRAVLSYILRVVTLEFLIFLPVVGLIEVTKRGSA